MSKNHEHIKSAHLGGSSLQKRGGPVHEGCESCGTSPMNSGTTESKEKSAPSTTTMFEKTPKGAAV